MKNKDTPNLQVFDVRWFGDGRSGSCQAMRLHAKLLIVDAHSEHRQCITGSANPSPFQAIEDLIGYSGQFSSVIIDKTKQFDALWFAAR
jgi:hypothetical protein